MSEWTGRHPLSPERQSPVIGQDDRAKSEIVNSKRESTPSVAPSASLSVLGSAMIHLSPKQLGSVLGGDVSGDSVLAPGPGHSPKDRSLSVKVDPNAPEGFLVHSFAGDDPIACRDYVRKKAGLPDWQPERQAQAVDHVAQMSDRIARRAQTPPSRREWRALSAR
jgi:hypothetical protein